MKLKKYIVAGLIGIVSLGSCTYLDKEPDTEIDIDMVFENKTKSRIMAGQCIQPYP